MGTELAIIDSSNYPALAGELEDLREIIEANVGPEGLQPQDLTRVQIPTGGSTTWQIEMLGQTEDLKSVEGVIVAWMTTRRYWAVGVDEAEETTPPDCASQDGLVGMGQFGVGSSLHSTGDCITCPMNQWGSGDNKGGKSGPKACREGRLLFIMREEDLIPVTVLCPPTSIKKLRNYMTDLIKTQQPHYGVVTKLELEKAEDKGKKWSIVLPSIVGKLDPEMAAAARQMGQSIKGDYVERMRLLAESRDIAAGDMVDVTVADDADDPGSDTD
jgi:hypothetical protein